MAFGQLIKKDLWKFSQHMGQIFYVCRKQRHRRNSYLPLCGMWMDIKHIFPPQRKKDIVE